MRIRSTSRRFRAVGALAVMLGVAGLTACDYTQDGDPDVITAAGSDTTQDVMGDVDLATTDGILRQSEVSAYNSDPDNLENVLSQEPGGNAVPGDEDCAARTYRTPPGGGEFAAPNGSSAGRDALRASVQNDDGCIDIARSSSGPRAINPVSGDLASFEYYAFALDAVTWSSASTLAPSNLTKAQLKAIYSCQVTNWSQVGGSPGPIERYFPQSGSGTRAFALSDLLDGQEPTSWGVPVPCPQAVSVSQENTGQTIAADGDQQRAIFVYSCANWVAQARGTAPDQRFGQTLRMLESRSCVRNPPAGPELATKTDQFPNGPVSEQNVKLIDSTPAYPGVRYVFNVVDSTHVTYEGAKRYVAFENVASGDTAPLCRGGYRTTIRDFGFGALDTTEPAPGTNPAAPPAGCSHPDSKLQPALTSRGGKRKGAASAAPLPRHRTTSVRQLFAFCSDRGRPTDVWLRVNWASSLVVPRRAVGACSTCPEL